jgi:hypothetical protein
MKPDVSRKRLTQCEVGAPPMVAVPSARLGMTAPVLTGNQRYPANADMPVICSPSTSR